MSAFGRGGALSAEYVAAGADLALVRVSGAGATELVVEVAGQVEAFDALPGAPGDDHVGFPVPLDLVRAPDSSFHAVVDGGEVPVARPVEAGARPPAPRGPDAVAE